MATKGHGIAGSWRINRNASSPTCPLPMLLVAVAPAPEVALRVVEVEWRAKRSRPSARSSAVIVLGVRRRERNSYPGCEHVTGIEADPTCPDVALLQDLAELLEARAERRSLARSGLEEDTGGVLSRFRERASSASATRAMPAARPIRRAHPDARPARDAQRFASIQLHANAVTDFSHSDASGRRG